MTVDYDHIIDASVKQELNQSNLVDNLMFKVVTGVVVFSLLFIGMVGYKNLIYTELLLAVLALSGLSLFTMLYSLRRSQLSFFNYSKITEEYKLENRVDEDYFEVMGSLQKKRRWQILILNFFTFWFIILDMLLLLVFITINLMGGFTWITSIK